MWVNMTLYRQPALLDSYQSFWQPTINFNVFSHGFIYCQLKWQIKYLLIYLSIYLSVLQSFFRWSDEERRFGHNTDYLFWTQLKNLAYKITNYHNFDPLMDVKTILHAHNVRERIKSKQYQIWCNIVSLYMHIYRLQRLKGHSNQILPPIFLVLSQT